MGLWGKIAGAFSGKDSRAGPLISLRRVGRPVWTSRNYRGFALEGYSQNVVANRSIRLIAENVAAIPFLLYDAAGNELETHPFLAVLRQPNPWQSGPELIDAFVSYLKIAGDAFLEEVDLDGTIRELYALRPDRMKPIAGRRGYPMAWEYCVDGIAKARFDMDKLPGEQLPILHVREFHPLDDWLGLSPFEAAAFAIDVHNAAGAYNKALLDNSAAPSGALVYDGGEEGGNQLTDDQFNRLKSQFEDRHQGPKNAGKPMLLEGGLKWEAMGMTPKEMEFVIAKREAAREIALAFGVPPMLLGIPGDNTYSNYKEANRAFHRQTILPLADKTCAAITNWMQPTYPGLRLGYNVDGIDALSTEREEAWKRVQDADFLTTDEKREATGYEPYEPDDAKPGGKIMVPGTMMPLDEAGFQPGGPEPVIPPVVPPGA